MKPIYLLPSLALGLSLLVACGGSEKPLAYDPTKGVIGIDPADARYYIEYAIDREGIEHDERMLYGIFAIASEASLSVDMLSPKSMGRSIQFYYSAVYDLAQRGTWEYASPEYYSREEWETYRRQYTFSYDMVRSSLIDKIPELTTRSIEYHGLSREATTLSSWYISIDAKRNTYLALSLTAPDQDSVYTVAYDTLGQMYSPTDYR